MQLKLEELPYQQDAVDAVMSVFDGTAPNTYDNATIKGIRSNKLTLSPAEIGTNIQNAYKANGIADEAAKFAPPMSEPRLFGDDLANIRLPFDISVEMETGTGKTLVYLKTIYRLFQKYKFTKFIILTPTIPVRQGVMQTLRDFEKQLDDIFEFTPNFFEYDSKRVPEVAKFAQEQHPQIMVMTTASITGDDRIINREQREDLFDNLPFIDLIARTRPVVIMDEPQMGMDADKTSKAIERLDPLVRIRYSATHRKEYLKNLVYRLTPADSYKEGLVKKIDVLTVVEKNDEASLKVELVEATNANGTFKAKLKAWKKNADGDLSYVTTPWMKMGDNLFDKTHNVAYHGYVIENIKMPMDSDSWHVTFQNSNVELISGEKSGNIEAVWSVQMDNLIERHFKKAAALREKGIKCLSLVFINRVANYVGDNPVIKNLFIEKYRERYPKFHDNQEPTAEQIAKAQGYYFAKTSHGTFADNDGGLVEQKRIYDLILKDKKELLSLTNPIQFIFSHSALGVGWDNPNVFQIATLSTTYSEIKKRQEIGRGLRICVDQTGKRIYDAPDVTAKDRINQLTVIPNESYETFAIQYQDEIRSQFGDAKAGAGLTHSDKNGPKDPVSFKRNTDPNINAALQAFWDALAKETKYLAQFDDAKIIEEAVKEIATI
ncbi:MAG: DEAD/DEAH box helicase family protein, partial [Pyrinomonadaceae bacterium]